VADPLSRLVRDPLLRDPLLRDPLLRDPWPLVALAIVAVMLVFVAWPLAELARQALVGQESGRFGFENFAAFFGSSYFRRALYNTLTVAAVGTLFALVLAVPLALAFARFDFVGKRWIEVAILMLML